MSVHDQAIVVDNLIKRYGNRTAVNGLSFSVERGEIFAILGRNGAGKTTTVEILEGYRKPDAGNVRVLGLDPRRDAGALKAQMGVMLQESGFYLAVTPREAVRLFGAFYPEPWDAADLLRTVGLTDAENTRYRRLSGGQKRRLALALALVGRPRLLFLDEPTTGLDPEGRRATWEVVRRRREDGATVLLTTHYLEEAERLADRVAIVNEGQLVAVGSPASLADRSGSSVRLHTDRPIEAGLLLELPSVDSVREEGPAMFALDSRCPPDTLVEVTTRLRELQIGVKEMRVGGESLEETFMRLTGSRLSE